MLAKSSPASFIFSIEFIPHTSAKNKEQNRAQIEVRLNQLLHFPARLDASCDRKKPSHVHVPAPTQHSTFHRTHTQRRNFFHSTSPRAESHALPILNPRLQASFANCCNNERVFLSFLDIQGLRSFTLGASNQRSRYVRSP